VQVLRPTLRDGRMVERQIGVGMTGRILRSCKERCEGGACAEYSDRIRNKKRQY
jgi:hypothetical protein